MKALIMLEAKWHYMIQYDVLFNSLIYVKHLTLETNTKKKKNSSKY